MANVGDVIQDPATGRLILSLSLRSAGGAAELTIEAGRQLVEPAEFDLASVTEGGGDLFIHWLLRR